MTEDRPIPDMLYKYVNDIYAVENIIHGKLKFASFYELNDATETATVGDESAINQALGELRFKGFSEKQFEKLKIINKFLSEANWAGLLNFENIEAANEYIRSKDAVNDKTENISDREPTVTDILNLISNKFKGLMAKEETHSLHYLCMSERYDSLPMWAHYANRGMGFVVAFKNLQKHFDKVEPWEFNGLHRVRYHESRPAITHDPMTLENLFLTKTIDWQYEKEVRIVKPVKDLLDMDIFPGQLLPRKYYPIDKKYVFGVIVGHQNRGKHYEQFEKRLKKHHPQLIICRGILQTNGQIILSEER